MAEDDQAKNVLRRHEQLLGARLNWVQHWQDLKDLVRPNSSEFFSSLKVKGRRNTLSIFDGTAVWANEQLAAGIHSFLTNPADRWFNVKLEGADGRVSEASLAWLEEISDIMFREYADPQVNFNPVAHEFYLDLGSFGTSVMFQTYNRRDRHIVFKTFALGDCSIAENSDGLVDTLSREIMMSSRQMEQEFGKDKVPPPKPGQKGIGEDQQHQVVHLTFPRTDRDSDKLTTKNMKFASVYVLKDKKTVLRDSGFKQFPYHVARWTKLAGETYGRSPAMHCLPDIKMINQMSKTVIKAAQKVVDPPLMTPDDGFILPIKTSPGSLINYDASLIDHNQLLRPLETRGQIGLGLEMMNQVREQIVRCFFLDFLNRPKKKERQTTTEILDDREETLRQLAPIIGRIQSEFLGPVIRRSYTILNEVNRIPEAPPEIADRNLEVDYTSQAALAQLGTKAVNIQRWLQDIIPLAQTDPKILDAINVDSYAAEMARLRSVSRIVINSPEVIEDLRRERAQQKQQADQAEQATQLAGAGKSVASAIKDISVAQRTA